MEWIKDEDNFNVPVKSWCQDIEEGAMAQAADLAKHPILFGHVALMPDCHQGYGMPIGGVIACTNAVIPNAVGVDIGCGMGALRTSIDVSDTTRDQLRDVVKRIKETVPCGEGRAHKKAQNQDGLIEDISSYCNRKWFSEHVRDLALRNLGTLGGGNHFIEIQAGDDNHVWLMIHSGSRHLGNVIARFYNGRALELNRKWHSNIPNKDLAFLPVNTQEGQDYIKDMNFALDYAKENRRRIMESFMAAFQSVYEAAEFGAPVNIHHNYAALESHFGKNVWVHRKGATSAKQDETGIIPGSMGTSSYIVKGLGNIESF